MEKQGLQVGRHSRHSFWVAALVSLMASCSHYVDPTATLVSVVPVMGPSSSQNAPVFLMVNGTNEANGFGGAQHTLYTSGQTVMTPGGGMVFLLNQPSHWASRPQMQRTSFPHVSPIAAYSPFRTAFRHRYNPSLNLPPEPVTPGSYMRLARSRSSLVKSQDDLAKSRANLARRQADIASKQADTFRGRVTLPRSRVKLAALSSPASYIPGQGEGARTHVVENPLVEVTPVVVKEEELPPK